MGIRFRQFILPIGLAVLAAACAPLAQAEPSDGKLPSGLTKAPGKASGKSESVFVAAGCFWCIESQMEMLKGVRAVISGYAGGTLKNPKYDDVLSGQTGHAEAVEIQFDPAVISGDDLLRIFFVSHDPTQLNRQGNDYGTQYRSAIFYRNAIEKRRAERIRNEIVKEKLFKGKVVTTIEPLTTFWRAEDYHQDYYAKYEKATEAERAQMNVGYCQYIVSPKVAKFREKFSHLLK